MLANTQKKKQLKNNWGTNKSQLQAKCAPKLPAGELCIDIP
jgi:hypothetical protein